MIKINLNEQISADPILELATEKGVIDLHNDFVFENCNVQSHVLKLTFKKVQPTEDYVPKVIINNVELCFENFIFKTENNLEHINDNKGLSLDNLSKSNLANGNYFYILSFTDGNEYELECSAANLILKD